MIFKIYNSDFGIKYNGVNYDFDHVDSLKIEDPENTKLIRGSNAKNKVGLAYTEGTKEAKKVTVVLVGISQAYFDMFTTIYKDKVRVECYCVDRSTGGSRIAKDCIIAKRPMQANIEESAESMNVEVVFESFNIEETHKD
jgi:hypothetical protein